MYESVSPSSDYKRGYNCLVHDEKALSLFLMDVVMLGKLCLFSGVVHNDMHGRNLLWRRPTLSKCTGHVLSLIDMDRSEYFPGGGCRSEDVARGVIKDVCTYIVESLYTAHVEASSERPPRVSEKAARMIRDIDVAMSACLKVPFVIMDECFSSESKGLMTTNFDVMEKWNSPDSPCKGTWKKYYAENMGQNFRVRPSHLISRNIGLSDCHELFRELGRVA
jgi:hypothetical protein